MVLLDLNVLPSWMPFGVAVLMLVVLALLWLSMRRHLRRADRYAAEDDARAEADAVAEPAASGASAASPDEK